MASPLSGEVEWLPCKLMYGIARMPVRLKVLNRLAPIRIAIRTGTQVKCWKVTMSKIIFIAAMLLVVPLQAFADQAAAAKCQASLNPEAKLIYDKVFPLVTPTTVIRDVLKQETRSLVFAGKVKRATARDSATAAGQCFRLLRQ
jgi:hypothetical protein